MPNDTREAQAFSESLWDFYSKLGSKFYFKLFWLMAKEREDKI